MNIRVLAVGDIIGTPGQTVFQKHIASLRQNYKIDAVIVNGENAADGRGITPKIMNFFQHHGVNMVTSGNHIWQKKEIYPYFGANKDLLRPANFPGDCPGTGIGIFSCHGISVGVINIQGRVFLRDFVGCPIKTVESALTFLKSRTSVILVDMHAEATSEKASTAFYFDGKISALYGTHTHVQTADERVLPGGTAFITDVGMCGSLNSVIGMKKEPIINHMLTQMPHRFEVETQPPFLFNGVVIEIDSTSGRAVSIERVKIIDE